MIISKTAVQRGFGKDKYKYVAFLTKQERDVVKSGKPVFFRTDRLSGGNHGTYWRKAVLIRFGIYPRVPSAEELSALTQNSEQSR